MSKVRDQEDNHRLAGYGMRDLVINRGSGVFLWDDQGAQYIDCMTGPAVACLGHAHPALTEAIAEQAATLMTIPGSVYNETRGALCESLARLSPKSLNRVFLCNSGTESIEAALKIAQIATGRKKFVSAMRGFHGRTHGSLSITHNPKYRKPFEPLTPGGIFVPFNNSEKIKEAVSSDIAGVVLEVVQGEGGVHVAEKEYLDTVQQVCRESGALLIIDEIQTGVGRTGKFFACEHYQLEPDMICVAKGLAGGVPIGAVICRSDLEIPHGLHGTTFGGNPLAARAALTTVSIVSEPSFLEDVQRKGSLFQSGLESLESDKIREVRGIGLMLAVELKEKAAPYLQALKENGVLALTAGATTLRFLPPLIISEDEIQSVVQKLGKVLNSE